ncbi:MAG: UDP-N-acetylmuramate dehydrogenase, partial [Clostridia bacterium]|nr:UDP-N-acetylmuramate dehydrogenase [Clostridia bacterium]
GNGSNVLISDDGIRGVVIKLMGGLTALEMRPDGRIWCEAGVPLKRLCTFALENDLTGLEFAYGIPGSVGGAVYMNAGAYGGEIKDVLQAVRLLDIADGRIFEKPASELKMAYRNTPFTDKKHVIIGAYFSLETGNRNAIREKMEELLGRRKASQPLNFPSAGSTFKRPAGAYAAALIDGCGLKGFGVGGAKVSEKHAGFVINAGGATCRDVRELMAEIKHIVYEKEGFVLEPEVELIGED